MSDNLDAFLEKVLDKVGEDNFVESNLHCIKINNANEIENEIFVYVGKNSILLNLCDNENNQKKTKTIKMTEFLNITNNERFISIEYKTKEEEKDVQKSYIIDGYNPNAKNVITYSNVFCKLFTNRKICSLLNNIELNKSITITSNEYRIESDAGTINKVIGSHINTFYNVDEVFELDSFIVMRSDSYNIYTIYSIMTNSVIHSGFKEQYKFIVLNQFLIYYNDNVLSLYKNNEFLYFNKNFGAQNLFSKTNKITNVEVVKMNEGKRFVVTFSNSKKYFISVKGNSFAYLNYRE